ncbi:MAG: HEAT repeat domain-containing protein [Candidatus Acidiferrales bacterium]
MSEDRKFYREESMASPLPEPITPCESWQSLRSLAAAGAELDPAEESRLSVHLAECAACAADFANDKETLSLIAAQHAEPDAALLASCRAGLQDALDREEDRGWVSRSFGVLLPSSWISPRPAWSAAILVLIGFSVGLFLPHLLLQKAPERPQRPAPSRVVPARPPLVLAQNSRARNDENDAALAQAASASDASASSAPLPDSALAAIDLRHATVAGINVLPSGAGVPPQVQLQLDAPQPFTLQGTVDDGDVRNVLLYVLRHGDLFAPDVRLGAVNALSPRSANPEIHSALSRAMQQDASVAVRLQALQALNSSGPDDLVGSMLLDALSSDQDPGVREQAIDTLRDLADSGQLAPTEHMLSVLRDRAHNDSDTYVRTQSAAVVRELVSQQNSNQ